MIRGNKTEGDEDSTPFDSSSRASNNRISSSSNHNNDYSAHMEKYRLVQEHKSEESDDFLGTQTSGSLPEVRITQQGKPRNYISYAMNLFESGQVTIVLKAMGRAINKAVTIAEILKRKMPLHQWNNLSSVEMIDVYEPVEEGLDVVTSRRYVSCMQITLSLALTQPNEVQHPGYQPPLSEDEMHQQTVMPPAVPMTQQPPPPGPPRGPSAGGGEGGAPGMAGGTLIST
uniref:DNA/RNA-binding protein Alba-like domain-containing protein n=1 Tax=Entomoneis paludosa TaxID=265537 RepID=A0A7S3DT23_9STRA|mmetsp:Transcript_34019/g.70745  ORF Transcript_34019/g.70745 Transcript_34019/m.70745 type:complete len:229 (+) Transcript_34019:750-1436(+)